jgi:hypothetical protein
MEMMTIDERLEKLVERHEALAQSVELLAGSTRDLRAVVEAQIARERERDEQERGRRDRDRQYLRAIADVLKHWANGEQSA